MRCSICASSQVDKVDRLLGSGSSVRQVARLMGFPRTTLARHRQHAQVTGPRFAVIQGQGGSSGPVDPLAAALELSRRAVSDRQRLKAAEQIRSATALELRTMATPDEEQLQRLDDNIAKAMFLYRGQSRFEESVRALQGVREAIRQRLDAVRTAGVIATSIRVANAGQEPKDGASVEMSLDQYFRGVPQRFRNPDGYVVERTLRLRFGSGPADEEVNVYDASGALVWAK